MATIYVLKTLIKEVTYNCHINMLDNNRQAWGLVTERDMKLSIFDNLFGVKPAANNVLQEMKTDFKPVMPAHDILEFSYPKDSPFYKAEKDITTKPGHDFHLDVN